MVKDGQPMLPGMDVYHALETTRQIVRGALADLPDRRRAVANNGFFGPAMRGANSGVFNPSQKPGGQELLDELICPVGWTDYVLE